MSTFLAEIVGTAVLILLGNGVVANVALKRTKGEDSGWIVITTAWGAAVFVAVAMVASAAWEAAATATARSARSWVALGGPGRRAEELPSA